MDRELVTSARRFLLQVVPESARALRRLGRLARAIPETTLRREALSSIAAKDFHVHGGCILATFLPRDQAQRYVELVATFETAVDYLDNLCDRAGAYNEADFRALHESLIDAIRPGVSLRDYFRERGEDDGGYLNELVRRSQRLFTELPSYGAVFDYVADITTRYCELQSIKHLTAGAREAKCSDAFGAIAPELRWWEGAAACGSTMPTFALIFGAMDACDAARAQELYSAYFPHISAFHILLDYFIDQQEDREHGELNFVAAYGGAHEAREGIARIGRGALARTEVTRDPERHAFAVRAMCGFYCSRRKVAEQQLGEDASAIAAAVGVELGAAPWRSTSNPVLQPLLSLYQRMIRV